MNIVLIIIICLLVIVFLLKFLAEWNRYRLVMRNLQEGMAKSEEEYDDFQSRKHIPSVGDDIAKEMYQRLKKKELDEKMGESQPDD